MSVTDAMPLSSPPPMPAPHPLAKRLIARLQKSSKETVTHIRVLELGAGSGRNTEALKKAGIETITIADTNVIPNGVSLDTQLRDRHSKFAAVLTTHSLLHGYPYEIANLIEAVAKILEPQGLLYATFGSKRDKRFRTGKKLSEHTFEPTEGDERGIAHTYFDESALRALLKPYFKIERIEEISVDTIAGTWAHRQKPLASAVHWFIEASLRT